MTDSVLSEYWRSSASYRVRIALNLKEITARRAFVHLREDAQHDAAFRALNPAGLVPVWRDPDGFTLSQSLAIIEYLDEAYPDPPLMPADLRLRAVCREIAYTIACDIHPLGNVGVLETLAKDYGVDSGARVAWARRWIARGFPSIEARLTAIAGRHAIGDQITLADICLTPQVYNARRFGLDLSPYPRIVDVDAAAREVAAFASAAPEHQPDADKTI
ncbi:maleylacetoacetate isomerase [Methylocapsa palsarum]|uniref:Maleylpyruvate isomerase n=1 Tax=Methylocapsa palsarum TaxID=1612308 RepID=A0A1I3YE14_9HYPH|nr:maleylacetoacetate isomerase [Methylocapsa palsarum]SFK30055.1 maleylpyruvate isomerase [Methylocapsa palsarum]